MLRVPSHWRAPRPLPQSRGTSRLKDRGSPTASQPAGPRSTGRDCDPRSASAETSKPSHSARQSSILLEGSTTTVGLVRTGYGAIRTDCMVTGSSPRAAPTVRRATNAGVGQTVLLAQPVPASTAGLSWTSAVPRPTPLPPGNSQRDEGFRPWRQTTAFNPANVCSRRHGERTLPGVRPIRTPSRIPDADTSRRALTRLETMPPPSLADPLRSLESILPRPGRLPTRAWRTYAFDPAGLHSPPSE